jgi:thiamine biosynthesis lipoprotein
MKERELIKKNRRDALLLILLAAVAIPLVVIFVRWVDPGYSRDPYRRSEFLLDDYVTITAYGKDRRATEDAVEAAFQEIRRLDTIFNRHDPSSELSQVNRLAHHQPVKVSDDLYQVISLAQEYYYSTGGAFDITLGALIDTWDILGRKEGGEGPPSPGEIAGALEKCGGKYLVLNEEERTVFFAKEGMIIDLGGVGKGYAADRAAQVLKERGIKSAIVDMVSTTVTIGDKPVKAGGPKWRVSISNPRDEGNSLGLLTMGGSTAFSTSGDYQRFFEFGGKRFHHIIDPGTGFPAPGTMSDTVLILREEGDGGAETDILSTALFVMGYPRALEWAEEHGVDLLLVDPEGNIHHSTGLEEYLKLEAEKIPTG